MKKKKEKKGVCRTARLPPFLLFTAILGLAFFNQVSFFGLAVRSLS